MISDSLAESTKKGDHVDSSYLAWQRGPVFLDWKVVGDVGEVHGKGEDLRAREVFVLRRVQISDVTHFDGAFLL